MPIRRLVLCALVLSAAPAAAQAQAAPAASAAPAAATAAAAETPDLLAAVSASRRAAFQTQVVLDRAGFAPGVIDGQTGGNTRTALAAWRKANPSAATPEPDGKPLLTRYTITPEDVAGPFQPIAQPVDYKVLSERETLGFQSPLEALAERFHTSEPFLKLLNPKADFAKAGAEITVPAVGRTPLKAKVAKVEVDKRASQLRAYAAGGELLAVYPATIGSTDLPSPSGTWKVRAVAAKPTYTYDPARLTKNKQGEEKLTLAAGPNNPVGSTWIDLSKDTYGIHGTPDPALVGKRSSSGCVRLTNWDAWQLGQSVEAGTIVTFVG